MNGTRTVKNYMAMLRRMKKFKAQRKGVPPGYFTPTKAITLVDERYECATMAGGTKYWHLNIVDNGANAAGYRYTATVEYGKSNTRGMSGLRQFSSAKACNAWATGKIEEKLKKGYQLVCPANNGSYPVGSTALPKHGTQAQIKQAVHSAAKELFDGMPLGTTREVIVTVIVGGEVIQETFK